MKHANTVRLIHDDPRVMERFWAQVDIALAMAEFGRLFP